MKISSFLLALALCTALSGCNAQTQQQVEDTTRSVASDVKENAGQAVDATKAAAAEAEITTSVKSALMASDKVDTAALNVDTEGQTVYLRGAVKTDDEKALAEEIAKNTVAQGVTVTNELAVSPEPGASVSPNPQSVSSPAMTPAEEHGDHDDHEGHNH